MTKAPEADLTGWTAQPFTRGRLHPRRVSQGRGPGRRADPRDARPAPRRAGAGKPLGGQRLHRRRAVAVRHARRAGVRPGAVPVLVRGCVAKEFAAFATNADRPVAHYLRALARDLNEQTPGKGVGVIGAVLHRRVRAGRRGRRQRAGAGAEPAVAAAAADARNSAAIPGLSEAELKIIEQRAADEGLCAMGLRFSEDRMSPGDAVQDAEGATR